MPDSVIALLADWGEYIHDESTMRRWVGHEWDAIHKYHSEITDILEEAHTLDDDKGVVFDEWTRCNDIKRKRIPDPDYNVEDSEFSGRRLNWLISNGFDTTTEKGTGGKRAKQVASPARESRTSKFATGPKVPTLRTEDTESPGVPRPRIHIEDVGANALNQASSSDVLISTPPQYPRHAL